MESITNRYQNDTHGVLHAYQNPYSRRLLTLKTATSMLLKALTVQDNSPALTRWSCSDAPNLVLYNFLGPLPAQISSCFLRIQER